MNRFFLPLFALQVVVQPAAIRAQSLPARELTALDRYVAAPDTNYRYSLANTVVGKGYKVHIIDMTSQAWRSAQEVDRPVWRHWMIMVRPDSVTSTRSLLVIGAGNNDAPPPRDATQNLIQTAMATRSIVTEIRMVPNQPLKFAGDQQGRLEDDVIAYSWNKFLQGGDETWPARLPMTKAAVRAMDTVVSFCRSEAGGGLTIDGFVVAGGSKRGWTTWVTAAVDRRVIAIVPLVIDLLNIEPSFRNHLAAYGYYSPAVGDYERQGILEWQGKPRYADLLRIEDPFAYRDRVIVPKFLINATGDQFFVPDSWQFYFHDLPGVKYLRYVPNADHSLAGTDAWMSLTLAYRAVITNARLPQFTWNVERDGTIRVNATDRPAAVKLWQVTNPGARDFRLSSIGPRWKSTDLKEQGSGMWSARVAAPTRGWTAYMIELEYSSGLLLPPYKFTTGVKVVPDSLPFVDLVRPPG